MRKSTLTALFLAFSAAACAQGAAQPPPQAIQLKDGGKLTVQKDGTMVHIDAAGNRVHMRDGQIMETKDGWKLIMKNDAIWKQITERGTLRPVQ
jgi:uncharacterized membrane-anchored protein